MKWLGLLMLALSPVPALAVKAEVTQQSAETRSVGVGSLGLSVTGQGPLIGEVRAAVADAIAGLDKFDPILPYSTQADVQIQINIVSTKSVGSEKRMWWGVFAGGSKIVADVTVMDHGTEVDRYQVEVGTKATSVGGRTDTTASRELGRVVASKLRVR